MRVRAKLTLRNDKMLAARERLGFTQAMLAELAECPLAFVGALEALDLSRMSGGDENRYWQQMRRVADALELPVDDIVPPGAEGVKIESTVTRVVESDLVRLASYTRLALPSPSEEVETAELQTLLKTRMEEVLKTLSYREREIVKLRYGLGSDGIAYNLEETAHIFKVTREHIRQIEARAIRKMQRSSCAAELVGCLSD